MPCYSPWTQVLGGFSRPLACLQCAGCRLERSRQAAVRCMHEAKLHSSNSFITLTYADAPFSLVHRDWQLFAKRLTRRRGPFRFYMAGEYGEEGGRPHYHACLFGMDFPDRVYFGKSPGGARLYTSEELTDVWGLGHASVGEVTFESAAYVARYVMKKITGEIADDHYQGRVPEYCRSSTGGRSGKRGIGFGWFERYGKTDVLPDGRVLVNGVRAAAPRYYRKLLRERFPTTVKLVQLARRVEQEKLPRDDAPDRIRAKAAVAAARVGLLKRKL